VVASVFSGAGATHQGRRKHNEDSFYVDNELGLYIVADGVGGQDAGEVASALVCSEISAQVKAGKSLGQAIDCANQAIARAVAKGLGKVGMASTVVALLIKDDLFEIAWLGDSRIFVWDGKLKLISRDHSLVESMLASGEITVEEAAAHPKKNVILAALGGGDANINFSQNGGVLRAGSRFLLCSDGVSDVVPVADVFQCLATAQSEQEAADQLVQAAVDAQGKDNITAVVVAIHEAEFNLEHSDPHIEVVRTYDAEAGVYEYHRRERVSVSAKVKKLTPVAEADNEDQTAFAAVEAKSEPIEEERPCVAPQTVKRSFWPAIITGAAVVLAFLIWNF
jgi:serine/threonine protein phosphatase PrpC